MLFSPANDRMKEMVQENYNRIRAEVRQIVADELQRILIQLAELATLQHTVLSLPIQFGTLQNGAHFRHLLREVYGTAPFLGVAVGFLHETCRSLAAKHRDGCGAKSLFISSSAPVPRPAAYACSPSPLSSALTRVSDTVRHGYLILFVKGHCDCFVRLPLASYTKT